MKIPNALLRQQSLLKSALLLCPIVCLWPSHPPHIIGFFSSLDRLSICLNAEKSSDVILSKGICIWSQNSWISHFSSFPSCMARSNLSLISVTVSYCNQYHHSNAELEALCLDEFYFPIPQIVGGHSVKFLQRSCYPALRLYRLSRSQRGNDGVSLSK